MHAKFFLVAMIAALLPLSPAWSVEINDTRFGFRATIPDEFKKVEVLPEEKELIYQFMKGEPSPDHPATVIHIQRLGGLIRVDSSIKEAELPKQEGIDMEVDDFEWRGHRMDLLKMTAVTPEGGKMRTYTFQCPLAGEAVQLVVGGPLEQDAEIRAAFDAVAKSLVNAKPLHGEGTAPAATTRELSSDERQKLLWTGIFKMSVAVLFIAILVRALFRAIRGKKKDPA